MAKLKLKIGEQERQLDKANNTKKALGKEIEIGLDESEIMKELEEDNVEKKAI